MIVLHAVWLASAGGPALWAEDAGKPRRGPAPRGRPPRMPRPRPHPFALEPDGTRFVVTELAGAGAIEPAGWEAAPLLLQLPDAGGGPLGSPWLEEEFAQAPPAAAGPVPEARWGVPGLLPGRGEAPRSLLALATAGTDQGASGDASGITVAGDLRFAARCTELALELATRGRLVPTLERGDEGWWAGWRPLLDRHDRGRIEALRWSMPGSFLAAADIPDGQAGRPGDADAAPLPDRVLRDLMWQLTDSLARRFAADGSRARTDGRRRPDPPGARRGAAGEQAAITAWLEPLAAPVGTVTGDGEPLARLAGELASWQATGSADSEPVRTCFRISAPPGGPAVGGDGDRDGGPRAPATAGDGEGGPASPGGDPDDDQWRIEFLLQAVDDPSLLVPAATVWTDGPELTALERHAPHPDELLLRGLGRAARLVPSLSPVLASPAPTEQVLDGAGILQFLHQGAPVLEQAGFGVMAPSWWRSPGGRLALRLKARSTGPSGAVTGAGLGMETLCDVRWEAVLGDDPITPAELRQLARLKQPLVRLRGQWVELHHDDLAAAITAVRRRGAPPEQLSAGDVLRAALGLSAPAVDLPVAGVEADGWLGDLLAGADDRQLGARRTPEAFNGTLRPYQERGLGWLAFLGDLGLGACLADDMGLGKTAQLLALLVDERVPGAAGAPGAPGGRPSSGGDATSAPGPTLVLCPMSLVGNWQRETARFAPGLSVYVHHGPERLAGRRFTRRAASVDLVLSTYGLAARDRELLAGVRWRRVVLDEAQQIKNSAARTTQAVRSIPAERRIAMTGTPVENRLSELWSIMQFLNPGMLGAEKSFRERFAVPIERQGDEVAAARLRRITGPFVLRRLKTDRSIIADLPDKLEMKEYCNLTREQATLYQAVVDDMLARVDEAEGMERRGLVLSTMLKLKQVCNHPAQFLGDGSSLPGRSGKLSRLVEVLEEAVAEGDRSLVFTQFTQMGDMLERHLRLRLGCEVLWLHGGTSKKHRDAMVERFQGSDRAAVFLLSLKAGGTGLNLTAATQVVHFDRWWNPAVEDQATDRAFRIGQHRNVQVRKFVCGGTLEERIDEMIESKRALAERIVGTGEGWVTELSTEDLRRVVALSADAVGDD